MGTHRQGRARVAFGAQRFDGTVTQAAANVKPCTTARAAHARRSRAHPGKRSHGADGERCENTRRFTRAGKLQGPARSRPASSEQHRAPHRSWPTAMRIISRTRLDWIASGGVGSPSRCGIRGQDHQANGLAHSARSRWNARTSYSTPRAKVLFRHPTDKGRWCLPGGRRRANVWTPSAVGTSWKPLAFRYESCGCWALRAVRIAWRSLPMAMATTWWG